MTHRKISAKHLESLVQRGASVKRRERPTVVPEPTPAVVAEPDERESGRGLRRNNAVPAENITPAPIDTERSGPTLSAAIDKLIKSIANIADYRTLDNKPVRLDITRDEYGFIESIDIVRDDKPSGRLN